MAIAACLNFGLSENCSKIFILSKNFHPKVQYLGLETLVSGKLGEN